MWSEQRVSSDHIVYSLFLTNEKQTGSRIIRILLPVCFFNVTMNNPLQMKNGNPAEPAMF